MSKEWFDFAVNFTNVERMAWNCICVYIIFFHVSHSSFAHSNSLPIYVPKIVSKITQSMVAATISVKRVCVCVFLCWCLFSYGFEAYLHSVHRWLIISRNSNRRGSFSLLILLIIVAIVVLHFDSWNGRSQSTYQTKTKKRNNDQQWNFQQQQRKKKCCIYCCKQLLFVRCVRLCVFFVSIP